MIPSSSSTCIRCPRCGSRARGMVQIRQQLSIEPMREADVPTVQEIERHIFSTPWPRNAYYRELSSRNSAYYIVLRRETYDGTEIVGYGGMWRMYDEAH